MTDFIVGQVYSLQKAVWLSHGNLMTLRDKEPHDSQGVMAPGARLAVRKVVVHRSPEIGTYTDVFAEVLTGQHKGKTVNVGVISKISKTGYTKRDPEMLEPVSNESK